MRFVWFVMLWLVACSAMAQYPQFHQITTEEGLPSNEVYTMAQDDQGFLWLGCNAGLVRFNGVSFKHYRNASQTTRNLTGLCISLSGRIYGYNFNNQIFYWENDSLYRLDGWHGGVTNITTDSEGKLWVVGSSGLHMFDENTAKWKSFGQQAAPTRDIIINDGSAWFLDIKLGQVGQLKQDVIYHYEVAHNDADYNLGHYTLSVGRAGKWLLAIPTAEVFRLDGERFVPFLSNALADALKGKKCTRVVQMPGDQLWFCTYSGIVVYHLQQDWATTIYPDVAFSDVLLEPSGSIWLTSLHQGLRYIPEMNFLLWSVASGALPSNNITHFHLHKDTLYFASSDGYFGIMDLSNLQVQSLYLGSRADIHALYYDETQGQLFFNAVSTIYRCANGDVQVVSTQSPPLKSMLRVGDKMLHASSFGIYAHGANSDSAVIKLTDVWTRDLVLISQSQKVWAATNEGLLALNATTLDTDTILLPGKQVIALAVANELIYALLFTGDIVTIDEDLAVKKIATLPHEANGTDIEVAEGKIIYVTTNQGLMAYTLATGQWLRIDKTMGLASNNLHALKVYKDIICLATGNGLQILPLGYQYQKPKATVHLAALTVNGKPIAAKQILQLNYRDVLGFAPEASAYSSWGKFQFAYRFVGADTAWQYLPASTKMFAVPSIAPGQFTLQLKAVDHQGRDSENMIVVQGYVVPPFWQRWWFYVLLSALGVLLAYMGFRYRLGVIRRKQKQEMEHLQLENELELSQQAALKAQMNPHFIFNVLNSIKSYIYENDQKSAAEYLGTFAKLIRQILTMSNEPAVSLEEELQALELYIKLEAMLLEPPFEYQLNLDPNIDMQGTQLPALLIQPYVENAFKHGLRHLQGHKKLIITISQISSGDLKITIDDNGVGRAVAALLNKDRLAGHQPFATEANNQRLKLLNKNRAGSVNVWYEDKTDIGGQPTGTTVTITINTLHGN